MAKAKIIVNPYSGRWKGQGSVPAVEAALKEAKTVELAGKARQMNVILLAAPKSSQLKQVIRESKLLNALQNGRKQ